MPYLDYLEMTECQRETNLKQMLRKPGNGSLLPMLYRNVYESWENGMPICRRLDWEYPQDKKVLLYLQEFMIGDLLVVPEKKSLKYTCRRDCGCIRGQERYIRENAAGS